MKRTTLGRTALPAAIVLSFGLAACGASNETDTATDTAEGDAAGLSGTINGIGATSQSAAMEAWKAGFEGANPEATVNYDPQGSGAGRENFASGAAQFAGSDAYLDDEELELRTTSRRSPSSSTSRASTS